MFKKYFSIISVVCSAVFFASCSNTPSHLKAIPKESGLVLQLNPFNLAVKARVDQLSEYQFIKDLKDNNNDSISKYWEEVASNPFATGISLTDDIYIFTTNEDLTSGISGGCIKLSDANSFENFITKISGKTKYEESGLNFMDGFEGFMFAWNSEFVIALNSENLNKRNEVKEKLIELFNLSQENQLVNTKYFKVFDQNNEDISFMLSQNAILASNSISTLPTSELIDQLEGLYSIGHITFNNDQIKVKIENFKNEAFNDYKDRYNKIVQKYNTEINKVIPAKHLGLTTFSFNMEHLLDSLQNVPVQAQIILASAKPVLSCFGGSFCINFSDLGSKTEQKMVYSDSGFVSVIYKKMVPKMTLGFDLKDFESLKTILAQFSGSQFLKKENEYFVIQSQRAIGIPMYLYFNDKVGVITSEKPLALNLSQGLYTSKSLANTSKNSKIVASSNYFFIDANLSKYPSILKEKVLENDRLGKKAKRFEILKKVMENIEIQTKNTFDVTLDFNFQEKEGNVLKNILNTINQLYLIDNEDNTSAF